MDYNKIRPDIVAAIRRYADQGIPVGGFLTAVMANDLMLAIGKADDDNVKTIPEICCYVYNETPSGCHGSPEKVKAWIEMNYARRKDAVLDKPAASQ